MKAKQATSALGGSLRTLAWPAHGGPRRNAAKRMGGGLALHGAGTTGARPVGSHAVKAARCNERPISLFITTFLTESSSAQAAKAADDVLFCKNSKSYNNYVVIWPDFERFYNVVPETLSKTARSPWKRCKFPDFYRKSTSFAIKWKLKRGPTGLMASTEALLQEAAAMVCGYAHPMRPALGWPRP